MKSAIRVACAFAFLAIAAAPALARTAKSVTYEFEYASSGLGGGKASAGAYSLVGKINDIGSAGLSSSASYSMEPVVGAGSTPASVAEWSLY